MWKRILTLFGIQVESPPKINIMITSPNDMYVMMEVNTDGVKTSEPMDEGALTAHIIHKFMDQPLRFFNETKRLKVIHLKSGKVKDAALRIEFQ